ncbi:MAG TPA: hypothetical protein VK892_04985 [Pyrinomonadaceae bacterium]|nr:hypothetical protein [Pyrinomonadaceae bacterium]
MNSAETVSQRLETKPENALFRSAVFLDFDWRFPIRRIASQQRPKS